jgi:hypothetical protein
VPAKPLDRRDQHRRLIAATVRQTSVDTAVSHMCRGATSAPDLQQRARTGPHHPQSVLGSKVRRYVHLHVAPLADFDVCEIEGQRVTTLGRTVVDLLRTLPMERSVPIGDAALRLGLTLEELGEVAGRCIGWRGMLQARRAINFLDARSESAGESYSLQIVRWLWEDLYQSRGAATAAGAGVRKRAESRVNLLTPTSPSMRHLYVGRGQTKRGVSSKDERIKRNRLIPTRLLAEGAVRWLDYEWS